MQYKFKRSFYYEVEKAINTSNITFILGPRKCGKTVCMLQLQSNLDNAMYTNIKRDCTDDLQKIKFINKIVKSIQDDEDITYLVDETTYLVYPDKEITKIAEAYSEYINHNTKVVFTSSQSIALEHWGHTACAGNASFVRTGFLSYPEWLAFKDTTEISEKTYIDFIMHTRDFYSSFVDIKDYLQGCLDETVISNKRAAEYIENNSIEDLDLDMLLDVLYASLVTLHNRTSYESFINPDQLLDSIAYLFPEKVSGIDITELHSRVAIFLGGRYRKFKMMTSYDCKNAIRFLYNCGLITPTYVADEMKADPYVSGKLVNERSELYLKPQIFSRFNLTINYPMFYVDLLQGILNVDIMDELPKSLLGSIVECHIRGLLPTSGAFEYNHQGKEIDYVSLEGYGIEISVSNKSLKDVNLGLLPKNYKSILLTKNITDTVGNIQRIPYYQFIYDNSPGKELLKKTMINSNSNTTDFFA